MFTSRDDLKLEYGVDMEIGKFLVDRKVPEENLYWKNRYLYIIPMPGYLFIPFFMDLQYRLGLSKSVLMEENHLQLLENILHSAAKLELNELTFDSHINECIELTRAHCKNPSFLQDLIYYFSGKDEKSSVKLGTPYKSLNRADAYLFSLCYFEFGEMLKKKLVDAWYALIMYYLIVDDIQDIESDYEKKEENAILEAGLSGDGAKAIENLVHQCYFTMNEINPVIANRIDHTRQLMNVKSVIDNFLKGKANR